MVNSVEPLRIAVLQRASVRGNVEANLAALDRAASQALQDGVDLLIAPEMYMELLHSSNREHGEIVDALTALDAGKAAILTADHVHELHRSMYVGLQ